MPTLGTSGRGIGSTESNVTGAVRMYERILANRIQWDGELYEQQRGCLEKVKAVDLHRVSSRLLPSS